MNATETYEQSECGRSSWAIFGELLFKALKKKIR